MSPLHAPQVSSAHTPSVSESCAAIRPQLDAFVDGEIDEPDRDAVLAHLARCAPCRAAEHSLRQLLAAIARTHVPVLASRRLRLRVALLFAEQQRVNG